MSVSILVGDSLEILRTMASDSVHCVVTSPPYWGLRDYGVAGQLGLEATPAEFIANMVEVFEEVRRVLRPDGTCWVNMGDSYAGSGRGGNPGKQSSTLECGQSSQLASIIKRTRDDVSASQRVSAVTSTGIRGAVGGLKPKDLVMMPHRLAIALQDAGWWVRQDIVWSKPNPMPESVRDRCTKAHEYIFLLTKNANYYFDQDSVCEPVSAGTHARLSQDVQNQVGSTRANGGAKTNGNMKAVGRKLHGGTGVGFGRGYDKVVKPRVKNNSSFDDAMAIMPDTRNKRSVWTMVTQSFKEAHFATFPTELPETCIKAGCPVGGIVLDPFFGAGTTGLVADRLQRDCIGIELNPAYAEMARARIQAESTLFANVQVAA